MTMHVSGLGRDGHVSALGIDRLVGDPPDAAGIAELQAHVADCAACQARVAEVQAWSQSVVVPLPPGHQRDGHASALGLERLVAEPDATELQWLQVHVADCEPCHTRLAALGGAKTTNVRALRHAKPRPRWRALSYAAALAATIALAVWAPSRTRDGVGADFRAKGANMELEVFAHDGHSARRVASGDQVFVGERIGFRLWVRETGFVLVVGADQQGHAYLCYPFSDAGHARAQPPTDEAVTLEDAVEMDEVEGDERILAVRCPTDFSFAILEAKLLQLARTTPAADVLPELLPGCLQHEMILHKTRRPASTTGEVP